MLFIIVFVSVLLPHGRPPTHARHGVWPWTRSVSRYHSVTACLSCSQSLARSVEIYEAAASHARRDPIRIDECNYRRYQRRTAIGQHTATTTTDSAVCQRQLPSSQRPQHALAPDLRDRRLTGIRPNNSTLGASLHSSISDRPTPESCGPGFPRTAPPTTCYAFSKFSVTYGQKTHPQPHVSRNLLKKMDANVNGLNDSRLEQR